jgi:ferredoxin--NADP+ reductase
MSVGTSERPLRVAIVGAGPAGFYVAEHLQKHGEVACVIDLFDRLPTPYGLVRLGVAPDHQKIKSVTKAYEKVAAHAGFRFFGGVTFGQHVSRADLEAHYDAVVLTVGAPTDRRMGIDGEDLPGSLSATDFVAWYNAHPDYRHLTVDLSATDAVVVGNGNVAVDVARILVRDPDELATTDIADHALEALRASRVRTVTMLGRRGPAQAAFTTKEIRELGELAGVTLVVDPADLTNLGELDEDARRVIDALHEVAGRTPDPGDRVIRLVFLTSPTALTGTDRVAGVVTVENDLVMTDGVPRPVATERTGVIAAGLVLRAVGYRGVALPDVPFDERSGTVPHSAGAVTGAPGLYVAGWVKRGPQGVIGTNKQDARETVTALLADVAAGTVCRSGLPPPNAIAALVAERCSRPVTWEDWTAIDAAERAAGAPDGRPRRKFTTIAEMYEVLS